MAEYVYLDRDSVALAHSHPVEEEGGPLTDPERRELAYLRDVRAAVLDLCAGSYCVRSAVIAALMRVTVEQ